jgi:hypothetical protein
MKLFVDVVDVETDSAHGDATRIGNHLIAVAVNETFEDV